MKRLAAVVLVALGLGLQPAFAQPRPAPPLSAESFTHGPAIWSAALSPDGRYVAAIQDSSLGDALTIIDWRTGVARPTQLARTDRSLFLDWVGWRNDDRVVFALRQRALFNGDEFDTTRIYASGREGGDLTLMFGGERQRLASRYVSVDLIGAPRDDEEHILLGAYAQHGYTVFRTNVTTGRVSEVVDYADFDTVQFIIDGRGYPVMRIDSLFDGSGWRIYRRPSGERQWTLAHEVRRSASSENRDFSPLGPGPGEGQVYVAARAPDQEFQSIYLYDTATGALGAPVFAHPSADAGIAWIDENDNSVVLGCAELQRWQCRALRPEIQPHFDAINGFFESDADILLHGMSRDEQFWLISATAPHLPSALYVYDVAARHLTFVASSQPRLRQEELARTQIVNYQSRDGVALWGYLSTPAGAGPHPLVVMPHGGPEARDSYAYNFYVQYLAWRGYAVFQPNFRGSEGSGRSFAAAGYGQWGRRMQDDITDGVQHLIDTNVVDRERICIVGASYGGYAALAGAAFTPDLYKCAISIAGDSDLIAMLNAERREEGRGSWAYAYWRRLVGDPSEDRDALIAVSPARQAGNVRVPVLLIHGEDDTVVPLEQSELMRDALTRAGRPVELITIDDAGHSWGSWRREDRQRLLEETDRFLAQHIGPR
ncbi:MAG: S9 family peptidase [Phycisphaerales bacterium]|nr:S9 family peptidase [Hyphomonadaceae bacterium]